MSTKIKNAILISTVSDSIKLPIGNYEDDEQPYGVSVGQLKSHIDSNKSTVATSGSYNDLLDLPDLNDYALVTTLNTNFYNKEEVNNLLSQIHGAEFRVVEELPQTGEEGVIYLVRDEEQGEEQNWYDEYIWIPEDQNFELIGNTQTDLSGYYTKSQVDALIPTVNNSQITLQQGGSTVGTFRLNQSSGATINFNLPTFTQEQTDWNESDTTSPKYILNKPSIPSVGNGRIKLMMGGVEIGAFTTNQSSDDTITIPSTSQVQVDWNESDNTSPRFIKNKPTIPVVNNPTIYFTQGGISKGSITLNQSGSQTIALDAGGSGGGGAVQSNWIETDPTSMAFISNKPNLATVATSGSYNDLTNKPTIPTAVQSDWTQSDSAAIDYIKHKPDTLDFIVPFTEVSDVVSTTVAKADIIAAINAGKNVRATLNNEYFELAAYSASPEKMCFSAVIEDTTISIVGKVVNNNWTWESYDTVLNVQADWTEADVNSPAYINNKPNLATVATSGSYADLSNKPTIPSNTRSLLITYNDQSTETITVYTT